MVATNFQTAKEKARIKRAVLQLLASLPHGAQEDVLADIVLAYEEGEAGTQLELMPVHKNGAGRRGRPVATSSAGKTETVEATLRAHPRMPIIEIAKTAYPGEEEATHKVRAILWSLKRQGRAKNVGTGLWEVTG